MDGISLRRLIGHEFVRGNEIFVLIEKELPLSRFFYRITSKFNRYFLFADERN